MSEYLNSKKALAFICVTVFINTLGLGIIIPVLPKLVMALTGEDVSGASLYGGGLLFIYAFMQFLGAPVIGNLSDRFGRRPVLLLSLSAFGIDYLIMGFAPTIGWLFLGRAIAGASGATTTTANAFMADVSPPEKRAQNFGLLGAAWGVGFILGPVVGGLLGGFGTRAPFFASAALALLNVLYGFFVLPESLSQADRRPLALRKANPLGALQHMKQYPVVLGMFGVLFCYQIAHDANPSVWTYYTMEAFNWGERQVGYSIGFVGFMVVLVQAGLMRAVVPRIGERATVFGGFGLMAFGFCGFAFAQAGWMMYVFIVPFALGTMGMPALRSIMANQVPTNTQGALQGAVTSVLSLTAIIAPLIMTGLFRAFTAKDAPVYFPGAPFLTAGIMLVIGLTIFAIMMNLAQRRAHQEMQGSESESGEPERLSAEAAAQD